MSHMTKSFVKHAHVCLDMLGVAAIKLHVLEYFLPIGSILWHGILHAIHFSAIQLFGLIWKLSINY